MHNIILFDGVCHFCNRSVQFIINRDPHGYFTFASLQSETGLRLLKEHQIDEKIDSMILIEHSGYYVKADAVLRIGRRLSGAWKLAVLGYLIPKAIRNLIYDWLAKHRYRWFGQTESCSLPSPDIRNRFID